MISFNGTFIVALISFVIFILIMNELYYKPILKIVRERESFIDGNYSSAKNSKERANNLLEEKENKLRKASQTSKKIISDKVGDTNEKTSEKLSATKTKVQNEIEKTKEDLLAQENQLASELDTRVEDLAQSISSKLLGENS